MSGPWEDYGGESGPWDDYAKSSNQAAVKAEPENLWADFKHGVGQLADTVINHGTWASPATGDLLARSDAAGITPAGAVSESLRGGDGFASLNPEPQTLTGQVISFLPMLAPSIVGWEAGVEGLAESGLNTLAGRVTSRLPSALRWAGDKFAKGVAGTLGSDIATGESPDNALSGGLMNVAAESVFHTPQGLRLASAMIQKNEQAIMDAAAHIGITPTAAMVSMRKWIPTLEDLTSKVPGGFLITAAQKKALDGLEAFSQQVKSRLGYTSDSTGLGESVKAGLAEHVQQFEKEVEGLYDGVMGQAGKHQMTNTRRFVRKVQELYGVNPRPGIARMTAPPIVRRYMKDIEDAGMVPQNNGYGNLVMNLADARKTLKLLDDHIGTGEHADADTAAAKQMASALRKDIAGTFEALGLGDQWRKVQGRYAAGKTLINQAEKVFIGAKGGDDYYRRLFGNPWDGFKPVGRDTAAALKEVLPKGVMDRVAAEVFHRMGLEAAGAANAGGRVFSPATYLTNWNRLADAGSADTLFGAAEQFDAEALAKVSEGIKRAGRAVNHSNTASHAALWQMATMAMLNPVVGIPKLAAIAGGNALLSQALIHPQAARLIASAEGQSARQWLTETIPMLVSLSASDPKLRQAFEDAISGN